eukprot:gene17561-4971_t
MGIDGFATCIGLHSGQTCSPACPRPFMGTRYALSPAGGVSLKCDLNGSFDASALNCESKPFPCSRGPVNGSYPECAPKRFNFTDCINRLSGDTCTVRWSCPTGYQRPRGSGELTLNCTAGRTFDAAGAGRCDPLRCDLPLNALPTATYGACRDR